MTDAGDIWKIRTELESMSWYYSHDGAVMDVIIWYVECWPGLQIQVAQRGSGLFTEGQFAADGRLTRFSVEASGDQAEIDWGVLRRPALRTLRALEPVGREVARQFLAGVPKHEIVINGLDATEAMRMLMQSAGRSAAPQRKLGRDREDLIRAVAGAYRVAVEAGDEHPRQTLAAAYHYTPAHIGRLLVAARRERNGQPPVLGAALRGKAGETTPVPE